MKTSSGFVVFFLLLLLPQTKLQGRVGSMGAWASINISALLVDH